MAPRLEACLLSMQLALLGGIAGQAADLGPAHQRLDELSRLAEGHPAGMRPRLAASLVRIALAMAQYGGGRFVGVWDGLPAEVREALAVDEAAAAQFLEQESGRVPDAYELLAFYALLRGDVTAAAARLKEGTTHDPGSVELWHAYVGAVTGTQDTDAIRAAAEEALSSVKTGALYCTLAKAHHRRAEREQTEAALQAAVALGDKDAALAQLLLGLVRLKGGDAAGAIGPLQEACGQTRPEGLAETALALALALTGKQPEAAAQINQARTSDPANRLILRAAEVIGPAP
jgi:tetratricopeptide (TPR) repeat protein